MRSRSTQLAFVAVVALIALVVVALAWSGSFREQTIELVTWVRDSGTAGVAAFIVASVVATLLFVPASILQLAAGFAYGIGPGIAIVMPATLLAAAVAFGLARRGLRPAIERRVDGDRRLSAIDRAIGRNGASIVLWLRLSPVVPFSLLNYVLGVTRLPLRRYLLATTLGTIPGALVYVYLGSAITRASQLASRPRTDETTALYWVGLGATVIATIAITRIARRALAQAIAPPP